MRLWPIAMCASIGCTALIDLNERVPPSTGSKDASAPPDASVDAADAATMRDQFVQPDAGVGCRFLSPKPLFCDDFEVGSYDPAWALDKDGPGTLLVDPMGFQSTRSLGVTMPPNVADCTSLTLGRQGDSGTKHKLRARVRLGNTDGKWTTQQVYNFAITIGDFGVELATHANGANRVFVLEYQGPFATRSYRGHNGLPGKTPNPGIWAELSFSVNLTTRNLTVQVDGEDALNEPLGLANPAAGVPSLTFGAICTPKTLPANEIRFDEVAYWVE